MRSFQAADLARRTGDLLDVASREPVAITRHRKLRFVIMSVERFEALSAREPTQAAFDIGDLPADVGAALDAALERELADG